MFSQINAKPTYLAMWGLATLMVTVVSCCSLIGILIVPLISGPSFKTFNTLFTGLAVGSLTATAIFSLIPQAFNLHKTQSETKDYLYKSLVIMLGIYLFYCSERLMRIYFDNKEKQNQKKLKKQNDNIQTGDQLTTSQYDKNYENINGGDNDDNNTVKNDNLAGDISELPMTDISLSKGQVEQRETLLNSGTTNLSDIHLQSTSHQHHHHHHHHGAETSLNPHELIAKALKGEVHGGKARSATNKQLGTIAPVAWMIIIGDGLHNLIDGLSIGANFTDSINAGMTTSLAIIFEELPHELGDFAVLIASGMSVRQAVMFNFLSACTCYIGMIGGLLLGDLTSGAAYIFALAGGMFLYIALVDMMGELSAILEETRGSIKETSHLLLMQNVGMLSGIVIIFILALYGNG